MPKASINLVTVRQGGLDWQLRLLADQTFKDFEVVIVDAWHKERQAEVAALAAELDFTVIHLPLPQLNYVTELTHATNRNEALNHSRGEVIIFFDDYQQPAPNFVETHVKYCRYQTAVAVRQVSYFYRPGVDYGVWDAPVTEALEHDDFRNPHGHQIIHNMDPRCLWTNSSSVHIGDLRNVIGFDERYNGGTGGEDGDLGLRLHRAGCHLLYTQDTHVRHIDHKHAASRSALDAIPPCVDRAACQHDRQPFTVNQYHTGDHSLVSSGTLHTYRGPDGVKYYVCANCGCLGVIDSIEVLNASTAANRIRAKIFGVKEGRHLYARFGIPQPVLAHLAEIYAQTPYTYYLDELRGRA